MTLPLTTGGKPNPLPSPNPRPRPSRNHGPIPASSRDPPVACATTRSHDHARELRYHRSHRARLNSSRCRVAPVAYLFDKKGLIQISPTATGGGISFDDLFDLAVEAGAEDVREVDSDQSDHEVLWEVSDATACVPGGNSIGRPTIPRPLDALAYRSSTSRVL